MAIKAANFVWKYWKYFLGPWMLPVIGSFGGMLRYGLTYYDRLHVMMKKVSDVHGRTMAVRQYGRVVI